jgi:hypothetical protein
LQAAAGLAVTMGSITVDNSGVFTALGAVSAGSYFKQTNITAEAASLNVLGHNITANGNDAAAPPVSIAFASPVILAATITIDSSAGAGDIIFGASIEPKHSGTTGSYDLTLAAGTGNITMNGITADTHDPSYDAAIPERIGALTINSAAGVTLTASKPVLTAGAIGITHTGTFTQNPGTYIDAAGGFSQTAVLPSAAVNRIAANITTANTPISFNVPIELTAPADSNTLITFASSGGTITLAAVSDGSAAHPGNYDLILDADDGSGSLGNIALNGHVTVRQLTLTAHNGVAPGTDDTTIGAGVVLSPRALMTVNGGITNLGTITAGQIPSGNTALLFNGNYTDAGGTPAAGRKSLEGNITANVNPDIVFTGGVIVLSHANSAVQNGDWIVFEGTGAQVFTANLTLDDVRIDNSGTDVSFTNASVSQSSGSVLEIEQGLFKVSSAHTWSIGGVSSAAFTGGNGTLRFGSPGAQLDIDGDMSSLTGGNFNVEGFNAPQASPPEVTDTARITISGNLNAGGVIFDRTKHPENVTLEMTGSGKTLSADYGKPLGSLYINCAPSGTLTLNSDVYFLGTVTIEAGNTLDAGSGSSQSETINSNTTFIWKRSIKVGGSWINNRDPSDKSSVGVFQYNESKVIFTGETASGNSIYVIGKTDWYVFECKKPGLGIHFSRFENSLTSDENDVHTIHKLFSIQGQGGTDTSNFITLTRWDNPPNSGNPESNMVNWELVPNRDKFWDFDVAFGAMININHVNIYLCHSLRRLPIPHDPLNGKYVYATPYWDPDTSNPSYYNINWITLDRFFYSYTEDSNGNGRIDRVRAQSAFELINGQEGAFADFEVQFDNDYEVDQNRSGTINGFVRVGDGEYTADSIYIYIKEKDYSDTGAIIKWRVMRNGSLFEKTTGTVKIGNPSDGWMTTIDTVPPRVNYALALPAYNQIFLQFSEPIASVPGDTSKPLRFVFTGSRAGQNPVVQQLSSIEYLLTLPSGSPFTVDELAKGNLDLGQSVFEIHNAVDLSERAYDYNFYFPQSPQYPLPAYPNDWTYSNYTGVKYDDTPIGVLFPYNRLVDKRHISSTLSPPLQPPISPPSLDMAAHRFTDLLISRPPASVNDETYFVWPVWAKDNETTQIPVGGEFRSHNFDEFGLIWEFTGKGILQRRDILLQARRHSALRDNYGLEIHYDNVDEDDESLRAFLGFGPRNLWLPSFKMIYFSNIVPWPNGGSFSSNSVSVGTGGDLFNFPLSGNNYEDRKYVDFYFRLKSGSQDQPLYAGRLEGSLTTEWYRHVAPFSFEVHNTTLQRSGVTILNNVINPVKGEKTYINYTLARSGRVTVQVFTLDGTLVKILRRENRSAGEYREFWDGANLGGRPVARGMYFIRVVAPDIDEIRKVMVVK